jgi:hypothetical protein
MGMYDQLCRNFARDYGLFLNTDLSPDIKIGTVGRLRWGKQFKEDGYPDLQQLGVAEIPVTEVGAPYNRDYAHSRDTNHGFAIKLAGQPATDYLREAEAGVSLSFGKKWSYMVSVKGLRYQGLDMTLDFMAQLQHLASAGKLAPNMEFVVGVWTAESVSWVLSRASASSLVLKASADIASMADLGVTWTTVAKRGSIHRLEPHGDDSGVPLFFKLGRMRRNRYRDTRTGLFAAVVAPAVDARDVGSYELVRPSEVLGFDEDDD